MEHSRTRRFFAGFWEVAEVILIAFVAVYTIRTFIAQPFLVSGESMEPTYKNGEYLLVDELTYRFRQPERGEVVVFRYPGDEKSFFIKRIIGLPGETVTISDNSISISSPNSSSSLVLNESYLRDTTKTFSEKTALIGDDELYVMGDNRSNSFDSRSWGPLKIDHVKGLVRLRIFPFNRFGTIIKPIYLQ
jgi:signal peptidase I